MNKQEKYNLLARHLAGELAREEKDDFLKLKEENAKQYHILRVFWESYFPKKPHSHKRIMSNVMGQLYGDNLSSPPQVR
ncbi:MAG: hypothetical protein N4A74_09305 [Carboxylicivirga sp.]|jgi:hypothetical protein|nr:hypothetical protein [Carboxylicivirga sp.]